MSTKLLLSTSSSTTTARRVARAAMIVMGGGLLSGVIGVIVRLLSDFRLRWPGINGLMEVFNGDLFVPWPQYLMAFSVSVLIFNLMAWGVLANAFLPIFTAFVRGEEPQKGWRLASALANWLIIGSCIISLLAILFMSWFTPWLSNVQWIPLILLSAIIFSLSGLMMSILNAYEHFLMPAIVPVMYYIGLLFGKIVLTSYLGLSGLAWGVVLGALGGVLVQLPKLRQFGAHYTLTLGWRDPVIWDSLRNVARLLVPSVLSTTMMQLMSIPLILFIQGGSMDIFTLVDLNYLPFIEKPSIFFASSIAIAIFPTFSRIAAQNNKAGMGQALAQTLHTLLFIAMPLAVAIVILLPPIMKILVGSDSISPTTFVYGLVIIPYFFIEVINRAYFAIQDTLRPFLIGVVAIIVNIAVSLILVSWIEPPVVLPLAYIIAMTTHVFLLLWVLSRKIGGIEVAALLSRGARLLIPAGAMGAALLAMLRLPALTSLPTIVIGGAIYFATAWLLRIEETQLVLRLILPRSFDR